MPTPRQLFRLLVFPQSHGSPLYHVRLLVFRMDAWTVAGVMQLAEPEYQVLKELCEQSQIGITDASLPPNASEDTVV